MAKNEKKPTTTLEDTLKLLPSLLQERQNQLQNLAHQLEEQKSSLEKEKQIMNGTNKPSDVLHLNVGGTILCVLRRTLTQIEGSMLSIKFSGRWDDAIEKDRDGNYFIDQPIELFRPLLNFLRAKAIETPLAPPAQPPDFGEDKRTFIDFIRLVEFYGLTSALYPTHIVLHRGDPSSSNIPTDLGCVIESNDWSTYILQTKGHDRKIQSYEIALLQFTRVQIGWIIPSKFKETPNNNLGVGQTKYSIALECSPSQSGVLSDGSFSVIEHLSLHDSKNHGDTTTTPTIVRCEGRGNKWFVNEELVLSSVSVQEKKVKQIFPGDWGYYMDALIPAISIQGHWQVSQVEFSCP
mmetsp:Transcript_6502/g.9628  ORF Transcript_6502/g.9628 Transcript_6502/m.9628 type:complete len:350 (-) Transcript_6502:205-1254(-)